MTIRSLFLAVVSNRDFSGKMAKIGPYLVSILNFSLYFQKRLSKKNNIPKFLLFSCYKHILLLKFSPAALPSFIFMFMKLLIVSMNKVGPLIFHF